MIFLKRASSIGFYSDVKATELEFSKNVVMFTGYNGSGKTSFLVGMYSTLNNLHRKKKDLDIKELIGNRSWSFEVQVDESDFYEKNKEELAKLYIPKQNLNIKIRYIILSDGNTGAINQEKLGNYVSSDPLSKGVAESFIDFKKKIYKEQKSVNHNLYSLPNNENENIEVNMMGLNFINRSQPITNILEKYRDEIKDDSNFLSTVLFINEKIYHTTKNDIENLEIFSKGNNLDKSTYLLLNELSKEILTTKVDYKDVIEKAFLEKDNNINSIKEQVLKLLNKNTFSEEVYNLISQLNKFFNLTGKEVYISDDGFIFFKEGKNKNKNKNIHWYHCSKGEKNLLCLILLAYLNRNNQTIFILDEPDLSMHIEWQEILIPTLIEICPNNQYFISTHSPALIPDYRENIQFIDMSKIKEESI